MNLDKTAKALKKINRLHDLIVDIGESTDTERDLLKAYARDLYNSLCDENETIDNEISDDLKRLKKEEKRLKKEHKAATKKQKVNPFVETVAPPPVVVVPEESEPAPTPVAATVPTSSTDTKDTASGAPSGFSAEMKEIFRLDEVTELSDKLSQAPIKDLTKAMGINERIFTVNELFDGNTEEFSNLMLAVNGLDNYSEAQAVMMKSAASKYNWDTPEKQKKARTLVKLVQRRFK